MGLVVRDIETRSTVDLGDVGPHLYAAHPTTEVLSYGYCVDHGPLKTWHPGEPMPKAFLNGATWVAHNAAFEMAIERSILVPKFGFPVIPIERQRCTMAQVCALAFPGGLDKVARALELENQKDAVGARLMKKLARPRKPRKGEDPNGIYYFDTPELREQLDAYCLRDTAATREIFFDLPQLSEEEQLVWQLDQLINDRGFYLDRELAEAAAKITAEMKPRINDELIHNYQRCDHGIHPGGTDHHVGPQHVATKTLRKGDIETLLTAEAFPDTSAACWSCGSSAPRRPRPRLAPSCSARAKTAGCVGRLSITPPALAAGRRAAPRCTTSNGR